ncbi:MAG: hypothetical protein AB1894_26595 [Chloroflexota bacterium]
MESLSPEMQMLAILGATRALVAQSLHHGWPDESLAECIAVLDKMMTSIINPTDYRTPEYACIQFAPTGPIQEIAIANGWHEAYMTLSGEFDRLESILGLFPKKSA